MFACALVLLLLVASGFAQEPSATVPPSGPPQRRWNPDPEKVHDPSTILTIGGVSRCFATGAGVMLLREHSTGKWLPEGRIFPEGKFPAWHNELVPGNRGYLWAPDVIPLGDRFLVYYSVSTFGKNRSAIGLATGTTLDPAAPDWSWQDQGPVLVSRPERSLQRH